MASMCAWGADTSPVLSPDGQHIAFNYELDGNLDVCVMHADGSPGANLTDNPAADGAPTWSPDGTHIAFPSDRDGNLEVYRIAADATDPVNLTNHPADDGTPSWSPDGERIAFTSDRDGNLEIYVLHLDTRGLDRLTTNAGADVDPAWSPDAEQSGERHEAREGLPRGDGGKYLPARARHSALTVGARLCYNRVATRRGSPLPRSLLR